MDLLEEFKTEQLQTGKYNLDGPIGRQFKSFVDYWTQVVEPKLGTKIETKNKPINITRLLEEFKHEQLLAGEYNLDGPIGTQFKSFIKYWTQVVEPNLDSPTIKAKL